ncbi:MAG: copper-binding protein, partial [Boseongicola sp.]
LAHAEEMMMLDSGVLEADRINHNLMNMTEMAHDDANSVLLEPGKSADILWTFSGDAALELSCNIPGHRESGMLSVMELVDELD